MELLFTVAIIHFLASLSPGPDVLLMVRNTFSGGPRAGVATTGGIVTGVSLQITACLTGVAVLINQTPAFALFLSYAGATYLIYLGLQPWLKMNHSSQTAKTMNLHKDWRHYFSQGLFTNLLNPKAILFFLSLFTVLIGPEVSKLIQILAGIEMVVIQFISFSSLSFLLSAKTVSRYWQEWQHIAEKLISIILIILGIRLWLPF